MRYLAVFERPMGKVIIAADIHFGIPKRLEDILWTLRTIREYATAQDINVVIILGDLFHDRVNLNIEVLTAVYDFFDEVARTTGQEWVCFPGNHDLFLRHSWTVNSLHPLNRVLTIVEDIKLLKFCDARFWIVPFIDYEQVYMKAIEKIEEQYEEGDVLLTHVGVHNALLNECFLIRNWSVVNFEDSKFDRVFAGHFHCHQNVGGRGNVWYPGSPLAFTFTEGSVEHGFIVYDTESRDVEFVDLFEFDLVPGKRPPKFITTHDDDLAAALVESNNVRVILGREYSRDELYRLRLTLKERGALDVKWVQYKAPESGASESKTKTELTIGRPDELFSKWLAHDKPKNLSPELLLKLNEMVTNEAKDRVQFVEDTDE